MEAYLTNKKVLQLHTKVSIRTSVIAMIKIIQKELKFIPLTGFKLISNFKNKRIVQ